MCRELEIVRIIRFVKIFGVVGKLKLKWNLGDRNLLIINTYLMNESLQTDVAVDNRETLITNLLLSQMIYEELTKWS